MLDREKWEHDREQLEATIRAQSDVIRMLQLHNRDLTLQLQDARDFFRDGMETGH